LQRQYESEQKLGNFLRAATVLAVVIACLGLYALVAFSAAQRTREVGIRKVLGATVSQIVSLLSADFLKTVSLGVVIGVPIAYVFMAWWLDTFAYHIFIVVVDICRRRPHSNFTRRCDSWMPVF